MNPPEPDPSCTSETPHWLAVDVIVDEAAWENALGDPERFAQESAAACFAALDDKEMSAASLSILFTADAAVRQLNAQFRSQDKPTNVLSFPSFSEEDGLGDIAIAYETTAMEARDQGKSFQHHARHLVVHGILHLLGYDHEVDSEAEIMETLERQILARFGIPDPYAAAGGAGRDLSESPQVTPS